jgi:methionine synthase I (cobalamin-dependent)
MAPPAGGRAPPDPVDLPREFAMQGRALKESGVDLLLLEYIGYIEDIVRAIDAVEPVGLPVMVGIRHVREDGTMQFGETYDDLVAALGERKVDALLLMCSSPQAITAGLSKLRQVFSDPIGAYPNIGYSRASDALQQGRQWHALDTTSYEPADLARDGAKWLGMGAQIVGGCCGTTPEHIAAIRRVVPQS